MINSAELDYIAEVLKSNGYHVHKTRSFIKVYHHGDFLLKIQGHLSLAQVTFGTAVKAYNWDVKRIHLRPYRKTKK